MEIFNYCNQCKKSLNCNNFDKKKNGSYYTRCKVCRKNHNDNEKKKYVKKICSGRNLCNDINCSHCFNKSFASYDKKTVNRKLKIDCWNHTKNGELTPRDVTKCSGKKYWFQCDVCNHDFDSSLGHVSGNNRWCSYCANRKLCNDINCNYCFNKSFASYDEKTVNGKLKVDCWHPTKNGELTPRNIAKQSNKKYWFQCDVCNHDFDSSLANVSKNNNWCSYCANQNKKLCDEDKCSHCYNNSFASYDGKTVNGKLKVDCWHSTKNGELTPRNIAKQSNKKYWFQCDVCNHDFDSSLANVSGNNRWCSYCANQKLCNDINCNYCFNKSFASYDKKTVNRKLKIDCWNHTKNGELTPRQVTKGTHKKYWFQCDVCNHDFDSSLGHVSGRNRWCPNCKNKTELKLYNWLLKQPNIKNVKREYKPKWCSTQFRHINKKKEFKNGKYQYRYDFLITFKNNKKLIIELDGDQHFKQVMNWKTPLENQIRDKYKEFLAKKHKIPLTRCIQEDVYMDRNNWEQKLKRKLQKYN